MNESTDRPGRTLLASYLEKMAAAHTSIQDLQTEAARLRQDARADGFNMEAVHQLGLIVAKSPHDNGVGLLRDIFDYAHQAGIQIGEISVINNDSENMSSHEDNDSNFDVSHFIEIKRILGGRMSLVVQATTGLFVAGGFIWLLQ